MENITGLTAGLTGINNDKTTVYPWRPWTAKERARDPPYPTPCSNVTPTHPEDKHCKHLPITHPVKLYWPKSRCYDYMYHDAELLLRNYPVQATICLYEDSSSDEEDSDADEKDHS